MDLVLDGFGLGWAGLGCAVLCCVGRRWAEVLCCVVLCCVVLCCVVSCCVVLCVVLCCIGLCCVGIGYRKFERRGCSALFWLSLIRRATDPPTPPRLHDNNVSAPCRSGRCQRINKQGPPRAVA